MFAQIEYLLGLHMDLVCPGVFHVPVPFPYSIVTVVNGSAHHSECRVPLDFRIAERDHRVHVTGVEGLETCSHELNFVPRHTPEYLRNEGQ